MPSLNLIDRAFFRVERDETPSAVAVLMILDLPEDAEPDYLRRLLAEMRCAGDVVAPFTYRLRQPALRAVLPSLVELRPEELDLDHHLRHSALPAPGSNAELEALVSRLFSTPLDPNKPLWECHVIEGLENDRFAWFFKIHHALMDGVGATRRLEQMLDTDSARTDLRPFWTIGPPKRDGSSSNRPRPRSLPGVKEAVSGVRGVSGVLTAAADTIRQAVRPTDEAIAVPYTAPTSTLNRRITRDRRFATQRFELERIKSVADRYGVTVNDVFLALCAGGLRAYLQEIDQLPDRGLLAMLPVSIRPPGDAAAGNAISSILVKLRTEITDPAERIAAIADSTAIAKRNLQNLPRAAIELYPALSALPAALRQATHLAGRSIPPFNVLLSNVAGPTDTLYMRGARVHALYALTIVTHGMALSIATGSMSGWLNIGFTACPHAVPHLERLPILVDAALRELEQSLTP